MKLYKINRTYYYYHKSLGWLWYSKNDWHTDILFNIYEEHEVLAFLADVIKHATPYQFKRSTRKDVRRSVKTFAQRQQRAKKRLKELLEGKCMIDDRNLFCGGGGL
jgi:hypothetical protein